MQGYKVCEIRRPMFGPIELWSAVNLPGRVRYRPEVDVEPLPGNGPLAVFKDLESAKAFVSSFRRWNDLGMRDPLLAIFHCRYRQSLRRDLSIGKRCVLEQRELPHGSDTAVCISVDISPLPINVGRCA